MKQSNDKAKSRKVALNWIHVRHMGSIVSVVQKYFEPDCWVLRALWHKCDLVLKLTLSSVTFGKLKSNFGMILHTAGLTEFLSLNNMYGSSAGPQSNARSLSGP